MDRGAWWATAHSVAESSDWALTHYLHNTRFEVSYVHYDSAQNIFKICIFHVQLMGYLEVYSQVQSIWGFKNGKFGIDF